MAAEQEATKRYYVSCVDITAIGPKGLNVVWMGLEVGVCFSCFASFCIRGCWKLAKVVMSEKKLNLLKLWIMF